MKAEKRHEVRALMGEVHKAADNAAVSVLTREVRGLLRGGAGVPAEVRAKRVEKALALVETMTKLVEPKSEAMAAVFKAEALLQEAVEAGEPESKTEAWLGKYGLLEPAKSPEMVEAEEKAAALVAEALASVAPEEAEAMVASVKKNTGMEPTFG